MQHLSRLLSCAVLLLCGVHSSVRAQTMASAEQYPQQNASVRHQNTNTVALKQVLAQLESQYDVSFIYRSELVGLKVAFDENRQSATLEDALELILRPNGLYSEKVRDNFYLIHAGKTRQARYVRQINRIEGTASAAEESRPDLLVERINRLGLTLNTASVYDIAVRGKVTAEDGTGLPGVNVLVKGTNTGTTTDAGGNYSITVPDNNAVLVFSFIGFVTEEVAVGSRTNIDVRMLPDVKALSEVVVVGYGEQQRAKVTGAISSVSSKEITALPVAGVQSALQGRAAGVTVTNSGSPGTNPIVRIRGIGTVGNADPLYVIDGMPAGGLNSINPNDIESVEVLKDASAAAIYGSRAANGVVLITTKKGSQGKPRISVDSYYGTQSAWRLIDLLNSSEYVAYGTELQQNAGAAIPQRFADLGEFNGLDTDWQDEMFRAAPIQNHTLTISGGTENARYNVSGGYFQQEGIMLGTGFERGSFRANTEFNAGRVTVGQTLTLAFTDRRNEQQSGGRTQLMHITKMVPYIPVYDPTRLGGFRAPDKLDGSDPENPVAVALLNRNTSQDMKILGTAYADVKLLEGLKYRFLVGLDMNYGTDRNFTPKFSAGDFHFNAQANIGERRSSFISPLISNQLSYQKTFGQHTISAVAVAEKQTFVNSNSGGGGQNTLSNDILVPAGLEKQEFNGGRTDFALISYVGRLNYDFAGKYLLGVSFRRDGASRFAPGLKWGNFPAFSAGWRISEEAFMKNVPVISDLKLRGSYGLTGNNNIGDYRYQPTLNGNFFYNFGGTLLPAYTITGLANRDLTWETTAMTNLGLDVGLFNDQLTFSVEAFNNETRDMLLEVPIPPSLGYDGAPTANVGTVSNRGLEFMAGYTKRSGELQWSIDGNMTFLQNKLVSLGGGRSLFGPNSQGGDPVTFTEEGKPIGYFYGWVVDGIFQSQDEVLSSPTQTAGTDPAKSTAPGDLKFRDINNDGKIDASDRTNLGHYLPKFTYGLNGTANWKGFDMTIFFQGVQGNKILNILRYDTEGMTRLFNAGTAVLDRWTAPGQDTDVPRAVANDPNRNSRVSSRFIEDGSYLRLKNLAIGYTLPQGILQSVGKGFVSSLRVYVSSQNLLTFTRYTGYDPEIGVRSGQNAALASGVDFGQFPQARTFLGGIQIGF